MVSYEKYAEIRDARGVTDFAVAKGAGISQPTLSAWKVGAYTPKIDKIMKIAGFLKVPLEDLLGSVEDAAMDH